MRAGTVRALTGASSHCACGIALARGHRRERQAASCRGVGWCVTLPTGCSHSGDKAANAGRTFEPPSFARLFLSPSQSWPKIGPALQPRVRARASYAARLSEVLFLATSLCHSAICADGGVA